MNDTRHQSAQSLEVGFFDFIPRGAVGARLLQFTNRFTAYSTDAIEMKLDRMILGISPHNRSESDFPVPPRGRCWGAPFQIFKSIHKLQYLSA